MKWLQQFSTFLARWRNRQPVPAGIAPRTSGLRWTEVA